MIHSVLPRWVSGIRYAVSLSLAFMLVVGTVMAIAVPPSYAQIPFNSQEAHGQTEAELTGRAKGEPLTAEERLDRAYSISEAAGLREEMRQAEGTFDPAEGNESLVEKVTDFFTDESDQ